jgi:HD-like signal output (HDOD) protein
MEDMKLNKKSLTDELVDGSVLASPPDLLFKIINSLDSELSSYQIGEIIGHDQSVSAQVLKLSNSSFFGFKGEIKTLDRAINILGTKTVRNIAVTTLLFSHTNRIRLYNLDMLEFWLQTFLVADLTRELSQKVGLDGDEAYIAGLLHHIGKLILYARKMEPQPLFSKPHRTSEILDFEKTTWGIDSVELTVALLRKWNIPADIVEGVAQHQFRDGTSQIGKVVHLADVFGNIITDKRYVCDINFESLQAILQSLSLSIGEFYKFSSTVPSIAERGKMIMKVLSKNRPVASFHRAQPKVSLVSPYESSLSGALLKLLGFHVDVVPFSLVEGYENRAKIEEEARLLMQGTTSLRLSETVEKNKVAVAKPKKEEKGFFGNLLGILRPGKKAEVVPEDEAIVEEKPETTAISWAPIILFEHVDPVPINRLAIKILHVPGAKTGKPAPPADTDSGTKSPSTPHVLPIFFANPDVEAFARR